MQLIAEDLVIDRGSRRVIEGLSFTVRRGEALVLTGANGIGKTTLAADAGWIHSPVPRLDPPGRRRPGTDGRGAGACLGHANAVEVEFDRD